MNAHAELEKLRRLVPAAELRSEGGVSIIFLPGVRITAAGREIILDALLWPHERDGYRSRLFLSAQIQAPNANNWNVFSLQGCAWYACSWQGVPSTLPWDEMFVSHLRAFQ